MDETSDEALLGRFAQERDILRGWLRLRLPADLAEDVLQETYLVLHRRVGDFERGRDFGAWVRGIARNLALKARSQHGRLRPLPADALLDLADQAMDEDEGSELELGALQQCLQRLGPGQRRMLDLRYRVGMSLADLAAELGRSTGAMQVALSRLRTVLHECMRRMRADV